MIENHLKSLYIRCDKADGLIRVYDGARYLVLSDFEKNDAICNRIRYLISGKSDIANVISHNYARTKIDSYNYLSLENTLTLHNVIMHIKLAFDKDHNQHYCNIFLGKCSYQLTKN